MAPRDSPKIKSFIAAARTITGAETWLAIGLIVFAAAIPIVAIGWWGRPNSLADFVTLILVGVYVFAVITTFAIILLWGLGRLDLPQKFMRWLGVATIGEVAGLVTFIVKKVLGG